LAPFGTGLSVGLSITSAVSLPDAGALRVTVSRRRKAKLTRVVRSSGSTVAAAGMSQNGEVEGFFTEQLAASAESAWNR
jgi:hypothetical protein